jgi:exonuclease VII small subunit
MPKKTTETIETKEMPVSYEAATAELEALVRQMESAQLPLDHLPK